MSSVLFCEVKGHIEFTVLSYKKISVEPFSWTRLDTMTTMEDLPKEILKKIFSFLTKIAPSLDEDKLYNVNMFNLDWKQDFDSLCHAALVSRVWRQVAEDPSLWRRFVLVVHSSSDLTALDTCTRFSRVQSLVVNEAGLEQIIRLWRLVEHTNFKTVFCARVDFVILAENPQFLKRVTQLKHFIVFDNSKRKENIDRNLCAGHSTSREVIKIGYLFRAISDSADENSCKLKSLMLNTYIYKVDPVVLAKVVRSLERLDLSCCHFGDKEVEAFVDAILSSNSLKMLVVDQFFRPLQVEHNKLARAVNRLEYVNLVLFSKKQIEEIVKMCTEETSLKKLEIWGPSTAVISDRLIDKAKKNLENLKINCDSFIYGDDDGESDDEGGESEEGYSDSDNDEADLAEENSDND